MLNKLEDTLKGKDILILGFGKEGKSTFKLLEKLSQIKSISIADKDENLLTKLDFRLSRTISVNLGEQYLSGLDEFDLIIKSPGIQRESIIGKVPKEKISSQTDIFLKLFAEKTIGITGTKGKSTTSSLIHHILKNHFSDVKLVGNIGTPCFDIIEEVKENTLIVFELSSHQLDDIQVSPHIAVILNLFQEHLDHYKTIQKYHEAKFNIFNYQKSNDWLVIDEKIIAKNLNNKTLNLSKVLGFSLNKNVENGAFVSNPDEIEYNSGQSRCRFNVVHREYLPGNHNLNNIMAAICVSKILQVPDPIMLSSINSFKGLSHRMEYVGKFKEIDFYNDSIATIPEATMMAVRALEIVDTLIIGGKDRGIDYTQLVDFLPESGVMNIIFTGDAGKRIKKELHRRPGLKLIQKLFTIENYKELPDIIREHTRKNHICLLSPAAASYDLFKNFEERGDTFKKIAENI